MQVALDWLQHDDVAVAERAVRLGHESEAAFSRAFKRTVGISPGAAHRSPRDTLPETPHLATASHHPGTWQDAAVSSEWVPVVASEVQPGDRLQLPSGDEMVATRIECPFMGTDALVAFIEDTPTRWFKQPLPADLEVPVRRADR